MKPFPLILVLVSSFPVMAESPITGLLTKVPPTVNTIAAIRLDLIHQSPRGVREKWAQHREATYLSGGLFIPPSVKGLVVAAELSPLQPGRTEGMTLIPYPARNFASELAKKENGVIESIGGNWAVLSPQRGYITEFTPEIIGVTNTLSRQNVAKWIRYAKLENPTTKLSAYLLDALKQHEETHLVLAHDLQDAIDETLARIQIAEHMKLKNPKQSVDGYVKLLTQLKGFVFTVMVNDQSSATLQFDFAKPVGDYGKELAPFFIALLEQHGSSIEELSAATIEIEGSRILLKFTIGDPSLRSVLSLLPITGIPADNLQTGISGSDPKRMASIAATGNYYRQLNLIISDLRKTADARVKDLGRSANWYDTSAQKIEALSINSVDPELVNHGLSVSGKLRAIAGSFRGTKAQVDAFQSYESITTNTVPGWGWRYPPASYVVESNISEMRTKQAAAIAALAPEREKIWRIIEEDQTRIRQKLKEKYQVDFDKLQGR
jgi:hypothetical protein